MERASGDHPVAVALRQEVNFACPVPDCGKAILTYHHFDPPWRDEEHNRPEGMIALCTACHGRAEGGTWTREQLQQFKRHPPPPSLIRERFMWIEGDRKILYRLGGNYAGSHSTIINLGNHPVLREERSPDGRLLLSLDVLDDMGRVLLEVRQNTLNADVSKMLDIHINTNYNKIVFRPRKGRIVLSLRFQRISLSQLEELLDADDKVAIEQAKRIIYPDLRSVLDPDLRSVLDAPMASSCSELKDAILQYAGQECKDSDGTVPLIDLENATLHANGRRLIVRKGLRGGSEAVVSDRFSRKGGHLYFCFSHGNGGAAFAF